MLTLAAVLVGFALDLVLGDPRWLPHPVVGMGHVISWAEPRLRRAFPDTPVGRRGAGRVLAFCLPLGSALLTWGALALAGLLHPALRFALEAWTCYQLLATCELRRQSMAVATALRDRGLAAGREAVSRIVGRDTAALDEAGVVRAAVETVAENASDGVVAPLLYMMVGGAPLAMAYKAINTLDSMVGYKNERYIDFGRASAHLDDVVNFIPARLAALCLIAAAPLVGLSASGAWHIWRRDRMNHASPNSAQTEAAMAGALGVQLAGPASYFGRMVDKPTIGDATRPVEVADIARANCLMVAGVLVALVLLAACRIVLGA
ncbi:adenosylcobinamide-phosphate synthase CbiB [Collinsella tanakaei]|uniref:adenosylcobinamide-phosphate synthase CbiB n=1 Tax=Collinsella tanakaei TaxID=626935 RepID=UPI0025A39D7D|nr:adenosylcobinamide-phosphate synthase CbiB [Collinsella tanakaei]MDM8245731.1 adenosylcobinamide-phosphate synthase CbiB [Collinsella tanakaei]